MIKTPKFDVIENLVSQASSYVITDELPIGSWKKKNGLHTAPNEFTYEASGDTEVFLGSTWETGYDMTSWFSSSVTVPPEMDGKKVYLQLDFGGEALVRINGVIVGAVSSSMNSGWVHRDIIHIDYPAKSGTVYSIELEATVNSGGFCDDAMAGAKTVMYSLKTARLIAVDEQAEKYCFLLQNCACAVGAICDEVIKSRLYRAVDDSVHALHFDMGQEAFLKSVPEAEKILRDGLSSVPESQLGKVIMTGHSHLDVAWLWTIKEIVRKTARTFANNLSLMDIYPDFRFCQSQAVLYDFMKKYYPDIFERVKEKVKSGQWEITGTAWVEADTNIASGESLIRQLLYGRNFFMKEFGVCSDVYWLPDCFGFSYALPQIINKSGLKYFLTSKLGGNDTNKIPYSQFIWRSHSGDEVLAYLTPLGYGGDYKVNDVQSTFYKDKQSDISGVSLGMFGYGDGGGGCTYGMVENSRAVSQIPGLVPSHQGSVSEFFGLINKHRDELPVWDGELYYENHRGTYTSQAFVKKYNRKGEFLFRNAEILSVIAGEETGAKYNGEELERGWKLLLTNQFHDILPGTSIHEVYDVCREDYAEMERIGTSVKRKALTELIGKDGGDCPCIRVFNYNTWTVTACAVAEISESGESIRDLSGDAVPCCFFTSDGKKYVRFTARDVPPMGYKDFLLSNEASNVDNKVKASEHILENDYLRVELDSNANISKITDKRCGRQLLSDAGNILTVFQDKPIHESAWNLEIDINKKYWELICAESVKVIESSPVRGVVRTVRRFNNSVITQDIILEEYSDMVVFDTVVDWQETEKTLKAAFPVDIRATEASYEIAHGAISRPTHYNTPFDLAKFEVSAHKWADLSQTDYGISILNDSKYGCDIHDNKMRITLMRSPNCPDTSADKGINSFIYAFYPHESRWQDGRTVNRAFELNMPVEAYFIRPHKAGEKSYVEVSHSNVIVDALKRSEDNNGFILRVYESEGRMTRASVKPCFSRFDLYECDMMEDNAVLCAENVTEAMFTIRPYEVKTFRILPRR